MSNTRVEYLSQLDIQSQARVHRLTGIICTIGPACRSVNALYHMLESGMNVARINMSHGDHEYHAESIRNIHQAVKKYTDVKGFSPALAIAMDTKGPAIRTGIVEGDTDGQKEVLLKQGSTVKITTDDSFKSKCSSDVIYIDYKEIVDVVEPGKRIWIDDGFISVSVTSVGEDFLMGRVETGGLLGSRQGCNLPGIQVDLPQVSSEDELDLMFGVELEVDVIFASFIRDASGIQDIRRILGPEGENIRVIAKIENRAGVINLDEIITEADGIMVARGDMGVEIPTEKVFIAQKKMIAKCNKAGKPVICAAHMLESMVKKPRPTRAEASDVANAILDGADCVMLSGETARGEYPLQCIKVMAGLAREAEACLWHRRFFEEIMRAEDRNLMEPTQAAAVAAVQTSYNCQAAAIVTTTKTGKTARLCAKYRPQCPIIAVTRTEQVARQLQLHRGILPIYYKDETLEDWTKHVENRIQFGISFGETHGFIKQGQLIVCLTGWKEGAQSCNTVRITSANSPRDTERPNGNEV